MTQSLEPQQPQPVQVFHGLESFAAPAAGIALTIGNFDGVHLGHRRLVELGRTVAQAGQPVGAMTFEPHPSEVLAPHRAPPRLTTAAEKLALLGQAGADAVIVLRSDRALFDTPAEAFIERLAATCRPRHVVEGRSFRFGHGRAGSIDTFSAHGQRLGFAVHEAAPVVVEGAAVSSSAVRAALLEGRGAQAGAMLGPPHRVVGTVGRGAGRGAGIGFPTANLDDVRQLVPGHAVYAAVAQLEDGRRLRAAVNVGPQPTFEQQAARVEAHLLDFAGDLRGRRVGLWFIARLRGQERFAGVEALVGQLRTDVARSREEPLAGGAARAGEMNIPL